MRNPIAIFAPLVIAAAMSGGCGSPAAPTDTSLPAIEITIEVAPNVLNIQSQGEVVTIHTSLAYGSVVGTTVSLNGVTIESWKADNQGQFVAKFVMSTIKSLSLRIDELNTLRIEGTTTTGRSFWGSKVILVVDNAGDR